VGGDRTVVLALAHPVPNPTPGDVLLRFSLPAAGEARLEMLDLAGRRVWSVEGAFPAGTNSWRWDGVDAGGDRAGAGFYFVRLVTPWGARTERFVVIRRGTPRVEFGSEPPSGAGCSGSGPEVPPPDAVD
jgi:hypothetical protein